MTLKRKENLRAFLQKKIDNAVDSKDFNEAVRICTNVIDYYPEEIVPVECYVRRGAALIKVDEANLDDALKDLDHALRLDPNHGSRSIL